MKLFTRANTATVHKTLAIYRDVTRHERASILTFTILIPLSDFLFVVLMPLLISLITQSLILEPQNLAQPLWLLAGMALTSVVTVVVNQIGFNHLFYHEERVVTRLTERAMGGLLRHSHSFFANQKVGSLAGDVNTFSRSYMTVLDTLFMGATSLIVSYVASLVIIAFIAPILLIPLGALTIFVLIQSIHSTQFRAPLRAQRKDMQSVLFGTIADILGNQALVRMFSRQADEIQHVVNDRHAIQEVAGKEIVVLQRGAAVRQSALLAFQVGVIGLCIYLYSQSLLSIAALIFTIAYLGRVAGTMFNINSIIRNIEQAFLDAAKVSEILSEEIEVTDVPLAKELRVEHGEIKLKNVSFTYRDSGSQTVFDNLSLHIPAGQRVGIVGRSGGGKTTLTSLLLRYIDIDSGSIKIDQQDISQVTQNSLRERIAYVPQDPFLFHRSLKENIRYGKKDASDDEIIEAARQAHALDFIDSMPRKLDTVVGERGVKLSGGQRQRIAIARAILKDAPILVLDEATSALDSESEKLIQEALSKLMKGRTSIVIAHRLSTIAKLDRIVVLDNGRIVEDGTHSELLEQKGIYAKLWSHQSGGFIEE